ncbi:MAG: glycosyltransferase family 39 protein [Pseudomonadales bacterium]|nr:glycosyltransferase family 39 protein [Pseudomonadales bacterium]
MTPDGLIYASISLYSALGEGSFWFPYSVFDEPAFHHHPPLVFGLQSLFFRLLGTGFWVENVYQIVLLLQTIWLLTNIWGRRGGWYVIFLWLTMPTVALIYTDNFLEVTLTLFAVMSVWAQQRAVTARASGGWLLLAALAIVLGFLSKGPVALFPLVAVSVLNWRDHASISVILKQQCQLVALVLGMAGLLMLWEPARLSMSRYFEYQLLGTFKGLMPQVHGRDFLLLTAVRNLAPALLLTLGLAFWLKEKPTRESVAWLVIALSALLPMFLSPRQFVWYIAPCLPFFALAFASVLRKPVEVAAARLPAQVALLPGLLAVVFVYLAVTAFGTADNDYEEIRDADALSELIQPGESIGTCQSTDDFYRLFLYLARRHQIAVLPHLQADYIICNQSPGAAFVPARIVLESTGLYVTEQIRQ